MPAHRDRHGQLLARRKPAPIHSKPNSNQESLIIRACTLRSGAGLEGLQQVDAQRRPLGEHGVRVAIRSAALNCRDLVYARGQYGNPPANPLVPRGDSAGGVIEVGASVAPFAPGDRVMTTLLAAVEAASTTTRTGSKVSFETLGLCFRCMCG